MNRLFVQGMNGLGDNLYQRAVLKQVDKPLQLQTPWPQLYADLPHVECIRSGTRLRTQQKNEVRTDLRFARRVMGGKSIRWHYTQSPTQSILESLAQQIGLAATAFDMTGPEFPVPERKPYIVVRPVCLRREWTSDSRNPLPEYIAAAVEPLRPHFQIVSVADLSDVTEWALDPLPYADERYHKGELRVEELLGLVRGAAGLVGGVGWIVPAALAYRRPLFLIYGGWGYSNGPHRLFGRGVDDSLIDQVLPDEFCCCQSNRHNCDKRISGFDARARAFALRIVRSSALDARSRDRLVSGPAATV